MTVLLNKPVAHARGRRAAAPRWLRWRRTAPARPSARPPRAPRATALRSLARARWSPRTRSRGAGSASRLDDAHGDSVTDSYAPIACT